MSFDIIQAGEIQAIVKEWQERAAVSMDDGYRIALEECIHEMRDLLNKTEEEREKEAAEEYEAYFNSLTPDEQARLAEYYHEVEEDSMIMLAGEA